MEAETIREAARKQPFQPFKLKLVDGAEVTVRHPDFIAVEPNGRRLVVFGEDGSMSILEPFLILSIEIPAPQQSTPNPNGN